MYGLTNNICKVHNIYFACLNYNSLRLILNFINIILLFFYMVKKRYNGKLLLKINNTFDFLTRYLNKKFVF